jgi:hypothetical protein
MTTRQREKRLQHLCGLGPITPIGGWIGSTAPIRWGCRSTQALNLARPVGLVDAKTKAALFKQELKAAMRSRKEARMERDRPVIQMRSTRDSYRTIADRFDLSDAGVPHLCGR